MKNIIIGVVIILVIYLLYIWIFGDSSRSYLLGQHDARKTVILTGDNMPSGASADYTYSIWLYISNWNYRIGEKKIIFGRGQDGSVPAPELSLGAMMNNVDITLGTYASKDSMQAVNHTCTLENVPLQSWANIIVTLNNRSLDMYLDGKLVRTCVLPGVPKMSSGSPLVVSPRGGFEGYISNFQYFSRPVNPREAYAIYREGPGGTNWFTGLVNKYRLRIEFLKNNKVMNKFDI